MRLNEEPGDNADTEPLAGSLLLAHPVLTDGNFRRTVVLLTAHSADTGALGVVLNRPMDTTLGEYQDGIDSTGLADVPLYDGGPVARDRLILVAWKWSAEEGSFKLYFGIDADKARSLAAEDPEFELRGFFGHSGWSEGQLEGEIRQGAWVVSPLVPEIEYYDREAVWRAVLGRQSAEMRLMADEPDDPSVN